MAERLNISAGHLSRLRNGISPFSSNHLQKLAEVCGMSIQEFHQALGVSASPAQRLKSARKAAGYRTVTEAAEAIGANPNTLSSHENGNRSFPVGTARVYAQAFNVHANWLLFGEDDEQSVLDKSAQIGPDSQKLKRAIHGAFAAVAAMGHPINAESISEAAARLYDLED